MCRCGTVGKEAARMNGFFKKRPVLCRIILFIAVFVTGLCFSPAPSTKKLRTAIKFEMARIEVLYDTKFDTQPLLIKQRRELSKADLYLYDTLEHFYNGRKAYYLGDKVKSYYSLRVVDTLLLNSSERAEYDQIYAEAKQAYNEEELRKKQETEKKIQEEMEAFQQKRLEAEKVRLEAEEALKAQRAEELKDMIPYKGMPESELDLTSLGPHSAAKDEPDYGFPVYYWFDENGETLFYAGVKDGKVAFVKDHREKESEFKAPAAASIPAWMFEDYEDDDETDPPADSSNGKKYSVPEDDYREYDDFDIFYDDHYDDFIDIDEAEDYFYGW